ncbi:MAG TPA: sialidase family protein [Mycobacteriales bacterium]|nr:sialidase family protein [Mycobacteriales bacterium]
MTTSRSTVSRRTPVLLGAVAAAVALTLPALGAQRAAPRSGASYTTYAQGGAASDAGEPSVGVSWKTGAVFLQAGLETDRVTFGPGGRSTWEDTAGLQTGIVSLDPIAFLDSATGRLFVSQLTLAGSAMAYSDDDGGSWTTSQGAGLPAGVDHQTVGGGPYPAESTIRPLTSYPHAVYYCSQDVATAFCARSDTGGLTFGAGIPMYSLLDCGGLHGHVKVAPDGTVYLPNSDCGGAPALVVSTDAGLTWTVRPVPGARGGEGDPAVGIGRDGTVYFSYSNRAGEATVAVSRDRGQSWGKPVDLGGRLGLHNAVFPVAVAGDGDRAAVAFLATTTEGAGQNAHYGKNQTRTAYDGAAYHLYVSSTGDRGISWRTVDVTGKDPVQRGRICMGGTGCSGGDRNLLDFMDITVDRRGRVLVGWADGCTGTCVTSTLVAANTHSSEGRVTRQQGGLPLYRNPPPLA